MKKIVLFFAIIVLLPFGAVAQWNEVTNPFPGFDGLNGASIALDVNETTNVVERIAFEGVIGFPTQTPIHKEFMNDGSATFTSGNLNPTPVFLSKSVYADFDNDGDKDYLIFGSLTAQGDAPTVSLHKRNTSSWQTMTAHGLPGLMELVLIVEDFDNDGLPDVFVSGYTGANNIGYAGWFHNNGDFTFSEEQTFPGLWQASGDIGDVDWDGDRDIIYTGNSGGLIKMYLLRKNGNTFSIEDISTGQGFIPVVDGDIAFGDKNGDGFIDYFASAGFDGNDATAQFRKADGSGLFDQILTAPFGIMYRPSFEFTDTNNDGKIELFVAGGYGDPFVRYADLYENTSGDDFVLKDSFDGFSNGDVVIEDFNSDGYKDILYHGEDAPFGNMLRFYINESGIDTENPNAVCQNITVNLDTNGNVSITGTDVDGGSTDNSGNVFLSVSPDTFNCGDIGANTVTLTVADAAGNTATCTATVTVVDDIVPTTIGQDITIDLNGNSSVTITADVVDNGSFDNCTFTQTLSIYTFTEMGVYDVDLTTTDTSSNSSTETYQVTVINTLGVDDFTKDSFVIAPNPVKDILSFQVPSSVEIISVTIISPIGRVILQTEDTNNINVGHLPAGIYLVKVDSENSGSQIKRIIKQ